MREEENIQHSTSNIELPSEEKNGNGEETANIEHGTLNIELRSADGCSKVLFGGGACSAFRPEGTMAGLAPRGAPEGRAR
jgi:hypothetical protein